MPKTKLSELEELLSSALPPAPMDKKGHLRAQGERRAETREIKKREEEKRKDLARLKNSTLSMGRLVKQIESEGLHSRLDELVATHAREASHLSSEKPSKGRPVKGGPAKGRPVKGGPVKGGPVKGGPAFWRGSPATRKLTIEEMTIEEYSKFVRDFDKHPPEVKRQIFNTLEADKSAKGKEHATRFLDELERLRNIRRRRQRHVSEAASRGAVRKRRHRKSKRKKRSKKSKKRSKKSKKRSKNSRRTRKTRKGRRTRRR